MKPAPSSWLLLVLEPKLKKLLKVETPVVLMKVHKMHGTHNSERIHRTLPYSTIEKSETKGPETYFVSKSTDGSIAKVLCQYKKQVSFKPNSNL